MDNGNSVLTVGAGNYKYVKGEDRLNLVVLGENQRCQGNLMVF